MGEPKKSTGDLNKNKASKKKWPQNSQNPSLSNVFYGNFNSLEMKPNIFVVFAALWKWNLSAVRTLELEITHSHVL
jgi:hypothetical protein